MTSITKALPRAAQQISANTIPFNPQAGALIASAKIALPQVSTPILNSTKSLETATKNYNLVVTPPVSLDANPSYNTTYSTKSGKTKLSVIQFYEPNQNDPKFSGNFQSYNFSEDFKVGFFEFDNNKKTSRAYIEHLNKQFDLPSNSYLDFSKGITIDKALIISNEIIDGKNRKTVKTVQKYFEDDGVAFPPKGIK